MFKGVVSPMVKGKKRYLLFGVKTDAPHLSWGDVQEAIWGALHHLIGTLGSSYSELALILYDEKLHLGILRCSHGNLAAVRASLTLISEIDGRRTSFLSIRVSGTILTLKKLMHSLSISRYF